MVTTRLLTAQQFLEFDDSGEHYELIEGELTRVMSPSPEHAFIVSNLARILSTQVQLVGLGRVYAGDPMVLLRHNPDTVLAPDVAVILSDRLPLEQSAFMTIPPDLVIEVLSPSNSPREVERKIGIYLESGVKTVWIIDPRQRQVLVHTLERAPQAFMDIDQITGGDVLPGLEFKVSEIFDD